MNKIDKALLEIAENIRQSADDMFNKARAVLPDFSDEDLRSMIAQKLMEELARDLDLFVLIAGEAPSKEVIETVQAAFFGSYGIPEKMKKLLKRDKEDSDSFAA